MDIESLKSLVAQKESHTLEFKKSTTQLKPAFETLCAFLNEQGGIVLIGIADNGRIVGQNVTEKTKQEIAQELKKIEPHPEVSIDYLLVEKGKSVIVLKASAGSYSPYVYDGRPFQRNQSTTIQMSQHRYEQLLVKRGQLNHAWDELLIDYDIEGLDHEEIRRTVRLGIEANRIAEAAVKEEIPDLLKRLKLLKNGKLTNAAVVLFAKDVWPDHHQCHIKMARFKGLDKTGEFMDNQSLYGNAFILLSEASLFIRRHLPIASSYQQDKLERLDKPALPVVATREALINAICHRDYTNRSPSISLAIYDDRLEIWNPGLLPRELSIKDFEFSHESHPRNKLIADVFYKRELIEKWGTGITKMIDACKSDGIAVPEFKEYSGGLSVTFRFKEAMGAPMTVREGFESLNSRQQEIMEILSTDERLNTKGILSRLKDHHISESTLRRELRDLERQGIVSTEGQTTNRVWVLKRS